MLNKIKTLLKQLEVSAIAPIWQQNGNIAATSCGSKLLRTLKLVRIKTTVLGEPGDYLGSGIIPIVMSYDGLINFFNYNKGVVSADALVKTETSNTHKSVVLNYINTTTLWCSGSRKE